jgi:hypothetical protein
VSLLAALGAPLGYGALLWFLGAALVWLARPRPVMAALAGFPVAMALVALTAWGQQWGSYSFGWPAVAVAWFVAGAMALVGRRLALRSSRTRAGSAHPSSVWRDEAPVGIAGSVAVAGAMAGSLGLGLLVLWWAGGGSWEVVSQTWDAIFDANAVRFVYESGNASPATISDFASWHALGVYYPTGFHSVAALYMHLAGCDAVVATNVTAGLLAGGLWPSVVTTAARFVLGPSKRVTFGALALSWGFWGLPWGPLGWGVLWATSVAAMMSPLVFAGLLGLLGCTRCDRSRLASAAMFAAGVAAVALFHPRITVPVLALCYGFWLLYALVAVRRASRSGARVTLRMVLIVGSLIGLAGFVLRFGRGDTTYAARGWPVEFGFVAEVVQYAVNAPAHSLPQLISGGLVILGIALALRNPRDRHLVVLLGGAVALDILTATLRNVTAFDGLARFWYGDRYRTVGLPPFPSILVALVAMTGHRRLREASRAVLAAGAAVVVLWGAIAGNLYLRGSYLDAATHPQESVVSAQDREFYREVAALVPPGERVLNNANDGSALLYAYTGRWPVFLVAGDRPGTEHGRILWESLTKLNRTEFCTIIRLDQVGWVLNGGRPFSKGIIGPVEAPGMQVPPGFWATTPMLTVGDLRLYRVTGCPTTG